MTSFTRRQIETGLVVLAFLFLLGLAAYSYFVIYAPSKDGLEQAERSLVSEREVVMALEAQVKETPEGEKISTSELQEKVSVEPLTDRILLQIEQAELLSETLALSIAFTEGPLELLQPVEGVENIQEVLTTVELQSADYDGILNFITEIEAMDRIMIIEAIDFAGYPEVTQGDQENENLTATLTFSAFYRPDLIALVDTLPKIDTPAPANKSNPLAQNDGTDLAAEDDDPTTVTREEPEVEVDVDVTIDEDAVSAVEQPKNPNVAGAQTAVVHKVQKGETLSTISQKYFGDTESVKRIIEINSMKTPVIYAGETIIIPERP